LHANRSQLVTGTLLEGRVRPAGPRGRGPSFAVLTPTVAAARNLARRESRRYSEVDFASRHRT
jgi:hypothetical protein